MYLMYTFIKMSSFIFLINFKTAGCLCFLFCLRVAYYVKKRLDDVVAKLYLFNQMRLF